jgi:CheY-like chemotaxis protein
MKKHILIIEDNERNRELAKDLLEVAGFEVQEAVNAMDGVAIARAQPFDLILMDLRLPDMHGTAAAQLLRTERSTACTPIVFVTASVMAEGVAAIKSMTDCGYISKPIDTRTFARDVAQYIR